MRKNSLLYASCIRKCGRDTCKEDGICPACYEKEANTPTEKPQGAGAVPPGITVRFDDKGIHIVATSGNECFEMGRKYHYIPEARHTELMERADQLISEMLNEDPGLLEGTKADARKFLAEI